MLYNITFGLNGYTPHVLLGNEPYENQIVLLWEGKPDKTNLVQQSQSGENRESSFTLPCTYDTFRNTHAAVSSGGFPLFKPDEHIKNRITGILHTATFLGLDSEQ